MLRFVGNEMPLYALCAAKHPSAEIAVATAKAMTPSDQYRIRAARFFARARAESNAHLRAESTHLAQCYLRLGEHADRYSQLDIVYEPPLAADGGSDRPPKNKLGGGP